MHNGERSILIVVPRTGQDACRSLSHTFAEDSTVEVIVDRRSRIGEPGTARIVPSGARAIAGCGSRATPS
jgi:hypothetical protein